MAKAQNGACAICDKIPKRLVVDHDHDTGTVRALLCDGCNSGLGNFGGTVEGLSRAIRYLQANERS